KGWWGEGEVKFFIDGDDKFATIVGTGTEDYFGGSYSFRDQSTGQYQIYTTAYTGFHQSLTEDTAPNVARFGMYRWHVMDPVRFKKDLRVTVQSLGWGKDGRYLPLEDDLAATSFWYQSGPHAPFPKFPSRQELEVSWPKK